MYPDGLSSDVLSEAFLESILKKAARVPGFASELEDLHFIVFIEFINRPSLCLIKGNLKPKRMLPPKIVIDQAGKNYEPRKDVFTSYTHELTPKCKEIINDQKAQYDIDDHLTKKDGTKIKVFSTKIPFSENGEKGVISLFSYLKSKDIVEVVLGKCAKDSNFISHFHDLPFTIVRKSKDGIYEDIRGGALALMNPPISEGFMGINDIELQRRLNYVITTGENIMAVDKSVMEEGKAIHNIDERIPTIEGGEMHIWTTKVPIYNKDGTPAGIIGLSKPKYDNSQPAFI